MKNSVYLQYVYEKGTKYPGFGMYFMKSSIQGVKSKTRHALKTPK